MRSCPAAAGLPVARVFVCMGGRLEECVLTKLGLAVQRTRPYREATMRLDARIPVRILRWPETDDGPGPVPDADPQAVLLRVGGTALSSRPAGTWAATRHLPTPVPSIAAHPVACACCSSPRSALALLLSELFTQRALGSLGLFQRILLLVPPTQVEMVESVLLDDPFVAGRYRRDPAAGEN